MANTDVLSHLLGFVAEQHYLFFAPVSRPWQAAWAAARLPAATRQITADSTLPQLQESLESALPLDKVELSAAMARHGHLELLQFAKERGCAWGAWTCAAAAGAGQLELLQWCKYNGCPWDDRTLTEAARGGHLEVLEWARMFGCDVSIGAAAAAAGAGNLELLKYLIEDGFPCGSWVCGAAAGAGHLEVLEYLVQERECTIGEDTLLGAVIHNQPAVLEWALANGTEFDTLGEYAFCDAVTKGRFAVVQCLHRHGCPWESDSCLAAAVEGDHDEIASWIRENRS